MMLHPIDDFETICSMVKTQEQKEQLRQLYVDAKNLYFEQINNGEDDVGNKTLFMLCSKMAKEVEALNVES